MLKERNSRRYFSYNLKIDGHVAAERDGWKFADMKATIGQ